MKLSSSRIIQLVLFFIVVGIITWKQDQLHDWKKIANQPKKITPIAASTIAAHISAPLDQPSEEELREFPGAIVVESSETEGPEPGEKTRIRILHTHFKYPEIRTKEIIDANKNCVVTREEMVADHLLVTLPAGEDPQAFLKNFGAQATSIARVTQDANLYRLNLDSSSLQALPKALEKAKVITKGASEPDLVGHADNVPNNLFFQYQWSLNKTFGGVDNSRSDIGAIEAWDLETSAPSIIVAVVDTGICYTHEALAANMWNNPSPSADGDLCGWNAYANNGDPMDGLGHGTHCAGIIGAVGNDGIGISGVAWKVQLMACRWLSDSGSGVESDAIVAIDYARNHGAKILNCSWGGLGYSQALFDAFDRTHSAGMIVVAAAGNSSSDNDSAPLYPTGYALDNIVSVAATDEQDQLAYFSNYGVTTVHLAAPGVSIYSTWNSSDSSYAYLDGTSMAAPHVVGVLALMMEQAPNLSYQDLITALLASTDKIPALAGKTISGGRLNVGNALTLLNQQYSQATIIRQNFDKNLSVIVQANLKKSNTALTTPSTRAIPLIPAPLNCPTAEEIHHFSGAVVIEATEVDGPNPNQKIRLRTLKTHFKYPLIHTEELIDADSNEVITREEMVADHLLVTLSEGEDPDAFLKNFGAQATSITRVTQDAPLYQLQLASSSLEALPQALEQASTLTTGTCEPDFISHGSIINVPIASWGDPAATQQWGLCGLQYDSFGNIEYHGSNAKGAWEISNSAASVVVALIDSGIRYTDPNLAANIWMNMAPTNSDLHGWNASANNGNTMDDNGHGTLCAEVIGAINNKSAVVCGVVQKVQLMACKVSDGNDCSTTSDEIVGIDYACDHGAKILNYTRNNSAYSQAHVDAIRRARSVGAIVVVAAGDEASNNDADPCYPSNDLLNNIVTVAGMNETEELASFSNYGATTVHLGAPGNFSTGWNKQNGTSVAASFVTGALALMIAQFPKKSYKELADILLASVDKLPGLQGKTITGGCLNIEKALGAYSKEASSNCSVIVQDYLKTIKKSKSSPDLTVVPPRKTPLIPTPLNQLSDKEDKVFISVIQSCEIEGPRPGQKIRIRILDTVTQGQYFRIEELIDTASNLVITRKEMAADHFLVTLPAGEDPNLFLEKFGQDATSITQVTQATSLYQVKLSNPTAIETLPKVLKQAAGFTTGVSEPDFIIHTLMIPNDPLFKNQWGLSTTMDFLDPTDNVIKTCHGAHVDEAWNIRTEAPSVMVALIDSGVSIMGPSEIKNNLWKNPSYQFTQPGWGNATGIDLYPEDDGRGWGDAYNHANYSAGIIGATGNDGVGIAGIAWKVQLLNCKVCSYAGQGLMSDEIQGIDFALNHGAKILNCAFGNNNYSYCEYQAMERARAAGAIVVAAAGNEGLNNDQFPTYPASYQLDNLVAVAANTGTQELADFSNYGATTVHVSAPGVHIYSTKNMAYQNNTWSEYDYFDGTSAATAFVSGALALMREQFPLVSSQELIARLLAAVDKVPSSEGKTVSGGALNVAKALAAPAN